MEQLMKTLLLNISRVIVDHKLTWENHVQLVVKKLYIAERVLRKLCSDLILILLKSACDQIIENVEYFQFCHFQIIQIFHASRLLFGQNY